MKSLWIISFSFLFSFQAVGQDSYDRYTNFYSIEGGIIASSSGLGLGPTFSVYRNGHKIDAGLSIKIYDVWKDGPGILGTYLSYKYYPNQRKNDLNLYFGYHMLFSTHNRGKRFPTIYDVVSDNIRFPTYVFLLENLIGIGFDYQMGNNFYMFSDFSVGAVLDWSAYSDTKTQMEVRSSGLLRLGMGYNIGSRRAK